MRYRRQVARHRVSDMESCRKRCCNAPISGTALGILLFCCFPKADLRSGDSVLLFPCSAPFAPSLPPGPVLAALRKRRCTQLGPPLAQNRAQKNRHCGSLPFEGFRVSIAWHLSFFILVSACRESVQGLKRRQCPSCLQGRHTQNRKRARPYIGSRAHHVSRTPGTQRIMNIKSPFGSPGSPPSRRGAPEPPRARH